MAAVRNQEYEVRVSSLASQLSLLASRFTSLASSLSSLASRLTALACQNRPPYQTPPAAGECGLRNKSRWDYQPQTGCLGLRGNRRSMLLGPASGRKKILVINFKINNPPRLNAVFKLISSSENISEAEDAKFKIWEVVTKWSIYRLAIQSVFENLSILTIW